MSNNPDYDRNVMLSHIEDTLKDIKQQNEKMIKIMEYGLILLRFRDGKRILVQIEEELGE